MAFDVSKYADKIKNAQSARVDRDFVGVGDHVMKIEGIVSMTSENTGNDLVIIEGELMNRRGQDDTLTEIRCKEIVIFKQGERRQSNGE